MVEYRLRVQRFQGGSLELRREVFERGNAAAVLAYDPDADSLVLVEQFRAGAIHQSSPWLLELIAGMVEEGESPLDVIAREALEEAGCTLSQPMQIAHYLSSPGGSTEEITLFVALCDSTRLADYAGLAEESEDIKVHLVPRAELMRWLDAGKLNNGLTLIAAQWLALNFDAWKSAGYQ